MKGAGWHVVVHVYPFILFRPVPCTYNRSTLSSCRPEKLMAYHASWVNMDYCRLCDGPILSPHRMTLSRLL